MEYNSFYGGRRGASFVIVKAYKSIKEMVDCFKQGDVYETVNYDEYVIIDTENKNDKNNGKIFRRGYDYMDAETGGAVYIGQIQGPAGMAPHVEITTIEDVADLATDDNLELTDPTGDYLYRMTEGHYNIKDNEALIPGKYQAKDVNGNLIFDENGYPVSKYNDEIHYMACSVRDEDAHTSTAYIGFKIPYMVIDYMAESVDPYYHRDDNMPDKNTDPNQRWDEWDTLTETPGVEKETKDFDNIELMKRTDDESHPFYQSWNVKIPKGIKGDAFKRLRVSTVGEELAKGTPINGDNIVAELQEYEGKGDDAAVASYKKRKILVYDYYHYDRVRGGDPVTYYLGDYNMIDNLEVKDDGTVVIEYSHDNTKVYSNLFKWVDTIELDVDNGKLEIDYNFEQKLQRDEDGNPVLGPDGKPLVEEGSEPTHYETYLQWIKDIQYAEDGTITWTYSHKDDVDNKTESKPNFIKWIKEVKLDTDTGLLNVIYNYPKEYQEDGNGATTQYDKYLTWVKQITVDEDGTIKFIHTTPANDKEYPTFIKWVKDIELDENTGKFTINFNYETEMEIDSDGNRVEKLDSEGNPIKTQYQKFIDWVKNISLAADGTVTLHFPHKADEDLTQKIKWIDDIEIVTYVDNENPEEGTGTQKVKVTYNDGTSEEVGVALNYIMRTEITDDYHLVILHSDPIRRAAIVSANKNYTWDGRNDWQDMGSVKDDDGILIGYNIDLADDSSLEVKSNAINYLNTEFPDGLVNPDERGKLVTIGWDDRNKDFYAFDYSLKDDGSYKGWYFLGYIEVSATSFAAPADARDIQQKIDRMAEGSLWFVIEDF